MKNFVRGWTRAARPARLTIQSSLHMIGYALPGAPAGPLGCGGAILVMTIVLIALGLFALGVWAIVRDLPHYAAHLSHLQRGAFARQKVSRECP